VGASALLPARPAAPVPPRRRHRQAHRRVRRRARRTRYVYGLLSLARVSFELNRTLTGGVLPNSALRRRGRAADRGSGPQAQRHARHRQGQGALRASAAGRRHRVRGRRGRRQERPLRGRREAPRRDARRRQPWLRNHQEVLCFPLLLLLCFPLLLPVPISLLCIVDLPEV
jgi:hypothetical protein